ncbi:MAG: glycosyltransferase [Thermoplasmata archaeon]|nr:MAG: glycosyltransferase [Thermoplasmata archaeon]
MSTEITALILGSVAAYFAVGFLQLRTAVKMKRETRLRRFPKKDFFVSVIIPVREVFSTTGRNLESVCRQAYPRHEVIFVAELGEHPAFKVVRNLEKRYPHVHVHLSGPHDSRKTIAKCHNLIHGARQARGNVLLFGDSDVTYSRDWIQKMVSPLGEVVKGRKIHAVTSPFFIEPQGLTGRFIALSVSLTTFTTSLSSRAFLFPPYASGASVAIPKKTYDVLGMEGIWGRTFNDDLVLANTLLDSGYHIYNQFTNLNHPNEAFPSLKKTREKILRWIITVSRFGHRRLREKVPVLVAKNIQFQVVLVLSFVLFMLGFSWVFALLLLVLGYALSVLYRVLIGMVIEERNLGPCYLLTPLSTTAMIIVYLYVRTFLRTFPWGSGKYTVKERYPG